MKLLRLCINISLQESSIVGKSKDYCTCIFTMHPEISLQREEIFNHMVFGGSWQLSKSPTEDGPVKLCQQQKGIHYGCDDGDSG